MTEPKASFTIVAGAVAFIVTCAFQIAVVDDEAPVRAALGRLLRLADYVVAPFASGEEFLAAFESRQPDCVILDVHMPGLSGIEVWSELRSRHCDVPIVFITASDGFALGVSLINGDAERLLKKPFASSELLKTVASLLQLKS